MTEANPRYPALRREVLEALSDVARVARETGAATLAEKLERDRIPRLEAERFHLVVLGEFNHGKTSFVNALLEGEVLPTGVTPTTAVLHTLSFGERRAHVEHEDGRHVPLAWDALSGFAVGGAAALEGVRALALEVPAPLLADGVVLVDTPGVNDLNATRAEITYGYVPRSDAVIFVLDAGQVLKESERRFLTEKLLAQSRDKVLFVVNKADLLDDDERAHVLAYARAELARLLPEPKVFPVSAERALEGQRDESGLPAFEAELRRFLAADRGRVLLENALDEGQRTARTLRHGVEVQRHALAMDRAELDRRLSGLERDLEASADAHVARERRVRESLAALKAVVARDCEDFGRRFAAALPAEIEASRPEDLERYLSGFLEERFRAFAEGQAEEIARRVERIAEEAIAFVSEEARARGERIAEAFPGAPRVELTIDTLAYDVGVLALGAFGATLMLVSNVAVGGAMLLATPVLAWLFRDRADRARKRRATEEAPAAVERAAAALGAAFVAQIDALGEKLLAFVRDASEELARSVAEVVRHARAARDGGEAEAAAVRDAADAALATLTRLDASIAGLRASVAGLRAPRDAA